MHLYRPSYEQISDRAQHIWVNRGRPEGTGQDDWLEAERQLIAEYRTTMAQNLPIEADRADFFYEPAVGDYVQVRVAGTASFPEPRRVTKVDTIRHLAWVEDGEEEGYPTEWLTQREAPGEHGRPQLVEREESSNSAPMAPRTRERDREQEQAEQEQPLMTGS